MISALWLGWLLAQQPQQQQPPPPDPQRVVESVTVTAPGAARVPVTATATVLTADVLASLPSFTLDQKLVSTPGFSLFRRTSSRTANPTTQGVTLRGLSASGASRTLVLADDVPLNDPFGGWVYWNRVPAAAIERVDVVRGGSSDIFGSDALGGAIRVVTRQDAGGEVRAEAGNQDTARLSAYGGIAGPIRVSAGAERSSSEGYIPVEPASRGVVDTPAGSDYTSAIINTSFAVSAVRVDVGGSILDEDRTNGTPLQTNATRLDAGHAGLSGQAAGGFWRVRFHAFEQRYDQTFSAVLAARSTEQLTNTQRVDTSARRIDGSWSRAAGTMSWLIDGGYRQVDSDLLDGGLLTHAAQEIASGSAQLTWQAASRLTVGAGVRAESWTSRNRDDDTSESRNTFVAPRASVSWRATDAATLRATVFNAFRSPTINELYRSFRVGAIVTLPDAALDAEEAWGGEAALTIVRGRLTARGVAYATWMEGAIYSRTLPPAPQSTLTTRMRSNGDARAIGGEVEADARVTGWLHAWASLTAGRSVFTAGQLEGNRLPQVPGSQAAAGARVLHGRWALSLEARHWGRQFDDDRNTFELASAAAANALVSVRFTGAQIFASMENIFDARVEAGRTPLVTLGQPRTWQIGVRVFTK